MNLPVSLAIEAAIAGGKEICSVYSGSFSVEIKPDASPVTLADKNSNEKILRILETSGIPILSEESEHLPYNERKDWETFWLVDPLDGTKQFIKRNDEFTVNIALVDKALGPVMGILYLPVSGKLYFSEYRQGAYMLGSVEGYDIPSILKDATQLTDAESKPLTIAVNRSSGSSAQMDAFMQRVTEKHGEDPQLITAGSALKFGWLAEGRALYYPRFRPSMEWDTAAGHAIVKETGFTVIDADSRKELKYNKPSLLNPSFIACKEEYL